MNDTGINFNEIKCPESLQKEYELIYSRIVDEDEKMNFKILSGYYSTEEDFKTLFIRYRGFLNDIYDNNWGAVNYEPLGRPIRIGYLINPDKIFYSKFQLDDVICNFLRNEGAEIIQFNYEDIQLKVSKDGMHIYIKNQLTEFDAFLSYGYRSKINMNAYFTLVKLMEQKGVVCLHSHYHEIILNNKMLQSTHFAAANIPIPDTYQVFDISSCKDLAETKLIGPTIVKNLDEYGGDGVFKVENKWNLVNAVVKNLWKDELVLIQKMIPDSIGESIRVLCIEGKAFGVMKFIDGTGDFRSNVSFGETFICVSMMNDPKLKLYETIAENAVKSIGDVLIAGVDLLDSKEHGVVVLEINSWPGLYDIWIQTKLGSLKRFAEAFIKKIKMSIRL